MRTELVEWDCREEGCRHPLTGSLEGIAAVLRGRVTGRLYYVCAGCLREAIRDDTISYQKGEQPLDAGFEPFDIYGTHIYL